LQVIDGQERGRFRDGLGSDVDLDGSQVRPVDKGRSEGIDEECTASRRHDRREGMRKSATRDRQAIWRDDRVAGAAARDSHRCSAPVLDLANDLRSHLSE
jgi:hypothetical protein